MFKLIKRIISVWSFTNIPKSSFHISFIFSRSPFLSLLWSSLRHRRHSHYCRSCRETSPVRGAPETQQAWCYGKIQPRTCTWNNTPKKKKKWSAVSTCLTQPQTDLDLSYALFFLFSFKYITRYLVFWGQHIQAKVQKEDVCQNRVLFIYLFIE